MSKINLIKFTNDSIISLWPKLGKDRLKQFETI